MVKKILAPFKPLFELKYNYYIYHSGRGCGKSENIEACLILLVKEHNFRVLCVREFQSSIAESVKANLETLIDEMGLQDYFRSTTNEIVSTTGEGKFIFRGLRSSNAVNIKSIHNINITFIEEAESLSEKSWDLLVPSVMRAKDGRNYIIAALNPNFEEDVIWDRFVVKESPPNSLVQKLTQKDNPFFFETNLKLEMEHDRKVLPYSRFAHKWLGELQSATEDCLFTQKSFELMRKEITLGTEYLKIAIGVDPAMTNKDFSNQFGICVVGITPSGEYHLLGNFTDNLSPHEFALKVSELYGTYNADVVVVETNQGGDFLKSTLLLTNPNMRIEEVRATKDKMQRALPIANLAASDKIRLNDLGRNQLIRQMKCSTILGYRGPSGESPDALDAFCWAIYYLGELMQKEQVCTVFNRNLLNFNASEFKYRGAATRGLALTNATEGCIIYFTQWDNSKGEKALIVLKTLVLEYREFINELETQKIANKLFIPEDLILKTKIKLAYFEKDNAKIDEVAQGLVNLLKHIRIDFTIACERSTYKSFEGNILLNELEKFKFEAQKDNLIIRTLYEIVRV